MTTLEHIRVWMLGLAAVTSPALARSAPEREPPKNEEPAREEPEKSGGLGDLDDLLGVDDEEAGDDDEDGAPAELPGEPAAHEGELARKLSAQEANEAFVQAIAQMSEAASRLENARDAGLVTQRLQEEIIAKLDALIQSSNQQSSSSSSSSSQQQQQQQQQPQPQPQAQNQPGSTTDPKEQNTRQSPPEPMDPNLKQMLESASTTWGALPERVRDMLMDGLESAFSANYKSMTEAYYRRLADEAEGP